MDGPGRLSAAEIDAAFAPVLGRKTIGLAVSGGADSLALMLAYARWRAAEPARPRPIVYTLDHGLRAESAAEARFVAEAAARLEIAARRLVWEGPKPETGVQAAARRARYRLIGAAMAADGAEVLLTGHHRRDQAETVLMRLAHGSGVSGLAGMARWARVQGVTVYRPLLGIGPDRLAEEVALAGLAACADPSNRSDRYERVRWRRLLPALGEAGLTETGLSRLADRMARADAALAATADAAWDAMVETDAFGAVWIKAAPLRKLPDDIGVRLTARALAVAGGRERPDRLAEIEALWTAIACAPTDDAPLAARTLAGCVVGPAGPDIVIHREPVRVDPAPMALVAGDERVWDGRFRIRLGPGAAPVWVRPAQALTRGRAERLLDASIRAPMARVRAAPLVVGADETARALGLNRLSPDIEIALTGDRVHAAER